MNKIFLDSVYLKLFYSYFSASVVLIFDIAFAGKYDASEVITKDKIKIRPTDNVSISLAFFLNNKHQKENIYSKYH